MLFNSLRSLEALQYTSNHNIIITTTLFADKWWYISEIYTFFEVLYALLCSFGQRLHPALQWLMPAEIWLPFYLQCFASTTLILCSSSSLSRCEEERRVVHAPRMEMVQKGAGIINLECNLLNSIKFHYKTNKQQRKQEFDRSQTIHFDNFAQKTLYFILFIVRPLGLIMP